MIVAVTAMAVPTALIEWSNPTDSIVGFIVSVATGILAYGVAVLVLDVADIRSIALARWRSRRATAPSADQAG